MASNDGYDKKRPVAILTRGNKDQWFFLFKQWLIGEGLWQVVNPDIQGIDSDITPASTPRSLASDNGKPFSLDGTQSSTETIKQDAKVQYTINICISEDDREYIADFHTARSQWSILLRKYSEKLATVNRQYVVELTNYKKPADKTIDEAWAEISKLGRKIAATQPDLKALNSNRQRLGTLLKSLPSDYDALIDGFDAQNDPDTDTVLQKLQEKEAALKALATATAETAMYSKANAKQNRPQRRRPYNYASSSNSEDNKPRKPSKSYKPRGTFHKSAGGAGCFICGGTDHRMSGCEFYDELLALRKRIKKKISHELKNNKHKHRAFNAADEGSGPSSDHIVTESDEDPEEEVAALSKEMVSKVPKQKWVADTGASSPMTDDLSLFRGTLTPIKRRRVKVGGGVLWSDQRGTALMRTENGSCYLAKTLYVPGLGVNLVSGRQLCKTGLRGSFDTDGLYMHTPNGKQVLKAPNQGGVYIINTIAPELDKYSLMKTMASDESKAYPALHDLTAKPILEQEMSIDPVQPAEVFSSEPIESVPTTPQAKAAATNEAPNAANEPVNPKSKIGMYRLWHRRFGHLGSAKLRNLHKVTTLKNPIPIVEEQDPCEVCSMTKLTNRRNHTCSERKKEILEDISIDICGELPRSRLGYRYFIEIVDNHSRRSWILFLRKRSDAQAALEQWRLKVEFKAQVKVRAVRSDNAPELKEILDQWASSIGITPEYTVPYNSYQNGIAERGIRTHENQIRAMLKDAGLPIEFWPEAGKADSYIRNRTAIGPVVNGSPITPMEAFNGTKPSIDHIRVWGCKCYSSIASESLPKGTRHDTFMDTGRPGVFLGYDEETDGQYHIWAPDLKKLIKSHAVKFLEHSQWGTADLNLPVQTMNKLPVRRPVGRPRKEPAPTAHPVTVPPPVTIEGSPPVEAPVLNEIDETKNDPDFVLDQEGDKAEPTITSPRETRPKTTADALPEPPMTKQFLHISIPKRRRDSSSDQDDIAEHRQKILRAMAALFAHDSCDDEEAEHALLADTDGDSRFDSKLVIPVPDSYEEAINDPVWGKLWLEAIQAELMALIANGTWETVVPPIGANIVTSKWVFKAKMHIDGTLDKLKARLVARGFSQVCGVDYSETFAPTAKFDTLRLFLAIVALEDLECHQIDVNNAFTESWLAEKIYMAPPPGVNLQPGQALLIKKSLYGLKQAARDWHAKCMKELLKLGFAQTKADPCLLHHPEKGIYLLVYVDDITVASKSLKEVKWFKDTFGKVFKTKDLGELSKILGIRIFRDRKNRMLRMDQTHYLNEVLDQLHMSTDKHKPTEFPMNGYAALRPAGPNDERIDAHKYQHTIGKIMYAAIHTRPDICFPTGRLSQYLADPAKHHGSALKDLLQYIRSTVDRGIVFGGRGSSKLIGYSDSDYAHDKTDRKSILGYVYMFAGGPISWQSRKQKSVASSTTEAEYMALSSCAKEGKWLATLLTELGLTKYLGDELNRVSVVESVEHDSASTAMQLMGDNQAANSLVNNTNVNERSKHIDVAYHIVRDLAKRNLIKVDYIPSADMVADGLTKPLPKERFKVFVGQLGLQKLSNYNSWKYGNALN